ILFYESWPDFDEFMALDKCPSIQFRPVNVYEAGGHTHVDRGARVAGSAFSKAKQNGKAVHLKSKVKRLYKTAPFALTLASQGLKWLNYSSWNKNRKRLSAAFREKPVDVLHIVNGGYPGATTARIAA